MALPTGPTLPPGPTLPSGPTLPPGLAFRRPATLVATCFGIGLLPLAPGTWASLAALPLGWLVLATFGLPGVAAAAAALFAVGWWTASKVIARGGDHDPSYIVIDEVAGQLVALSVAPAEPLYYAAAFVGFRFFDIVKPWPVSWADRSIEGGLGVMLDDVIAGLYVAAILFAASHYLAF
jgi:phosphatidylglycerophosphatase A